MRSELICGAVALGLGLSGGAALAQAPLSAIDWLSDSIATPVAVPAPGADLPPEAPVSGGAGVEAVTVTALDAISTDAVGLLPASVSGLPRDLWGVTPAADLAARLGAVDTGDLPAMQDLLFSLLLTELDPPADSDASGQLFLARIDKLIELGAVEQAQAMLERAGPDSSERFARWFDASLLTGTENAACETLRAAPNLSDDLPTRIFCLARGGDWNAAALTLETGRALGQVSVAEDAILSRFLVPELSDGGSLLPPPSRPSPLVFRLFEAVGEPLPTSTLPLGFAQADLRDNTGWKAQIEAAERLARSGALAGNKLIGLYTERLPAASGGVWDRVGAVQRFDIVLAAGAPGVTSTALPPAWAAMQTVGLETVFARLYSADLSKLALSGDARALAFRIALLSRDYQKAAADLEPTDSAERFLKAIARGDLAGVVAPNARGRAVKAGFAAGAMPGLLAPDRRGAEMLKAIGMMADGARGDLARLSDAIVLLRALGLDDAARRAALQVMILGARG